MNSIRRRIDRFCVLHPNFGIFNLMRFIVIGQAVAFLLDTFSSAGIASLFSFNLAAVLRGEVWRLVSFVFVPDASSPITFLIMLSFYYYIGTSLERSWGTAKFNVYYLSGMLLSVLATIAAALITGNPYYSLYNAYFLNLTLLLAFACLYPDTQVMLYFIIPIKVRWIAILDVCLFVYNIFFYISLGNWAGAVIPLISLANFFLFFAPEIRGYTKTEQKRARQSAKFHNDVRQVQREQRVQGYRHKCAVCGRTDTANPTLQFRYCSKCAGYHCYCTDHIFNHVHFTDEQP